MYKLTHSFLWCALLTMLGTLASPALAQTSGNASLRGSVIDPSGAVVPSAKLTLREEGTQTDRTATASTEGAFSFVALLLGIYTLKVEAPGFKAYTLKKLVLSPSETRGANVTLEISAASESVTVNGQNQRQPQLEIRRLPRTGQQKAKPRQ